MKVIRLAALLLLVLAGCGKSPSVSEREVRIRYVNMSLIFEYMVRTDSEAQRVMQQRDVLTSMISRIEKEIREAGEEQVKKQAGQNLASAKTDLEKIRGAEELHKQRLLNEINRAMEIVASRRQIDFIFGTGDSLVYAKTDFDVTEAVLQEIIVLKKRNAPVSR